MGFVDIEKSPQLLKLLISFPNCSAIMSILPAACEMITLCGWSMGHLLSVAYREEVVFSRMASRNSRATSVKQSSLCFFGESNHRRCPSVNSGK